MITKWKVSNFKSIREETELDFGPLTIFAGANSSGKSTFIQSVLLVAQTLAHKVSSRSVVLNGAFSSLGQFDDLKSSGTEDDKISIKCTCRPIPNHSRSSYAVTRGRIYHGSRHNQLIEIDCEMAFDADPSSTQRDLFQIQPRLFATQLSCLYRDDDNIDQKANITIRSKAISEIDRTYGVSEIDEPLRSSLDYAVSLDKSSMKEVREDYQSAKPTGCLLKHFLPERIIYSIDTLKEDAYDITMELQGGINSLLGGFRNNINRHIHLSEEIILVLSEVLKGTIDFEKEFIENPHQYSNSNSLHRKITFREWHDRLHSLSYEQRMKVQQTLQDQEDLFIRIYNAMKDSTANQTETLALVQVRPPHLITEAARYLDNYFTTSLKYLGPLRVAPKPLYPLAPAAEPHDVGLRGEHIASILEMHKSKKIQYIPSKNFKNPLVIREPVIRTLEAAIIDWLQYLGVASSVKSKDKGKLGHELKVGLGNSDILHDLTHVGVGVSQVLPILVVCLLADSDSTLVFEQPELHLHPKVQSLLGDFFLSIALSNKQCIVETHSEYIIDRLRFRIAAASPEKKLNNLAKIYFVEKPLQNSSFREVFINEYGAISEWPEGFFDQSQQQAEEILRAAAKKRNASRNNIDA